jgi:oxygen-independent coproporphyrinogen III oxidase
VNQLSHAGGAGSRWSSGGAVHHGRVAEVVAVAEPVPASKEVPMPLPEIAVYVHIPFCPTKCGYCDFNSYAMSGDIMGRTCDAIIWEMVQSPLRGRPAKTIFFGGGTPTYLPIDQLQRIVEAVLEAHPPTEEAEISSEANPGTVDAAKFEKMREVGFNRISLGAQSFFDDDLLRLGRVHRHGEIGRAVEAARAAGFDNLNLDLMFALPGQSMRAWEDNLMRAIELEPDHLSLYCLTIEPNTAFYKQHLKGLLDLPDDECQVEMYERAVEAASAAGFSQYEISNFARGGLECHHNLCYWRGEEYVGYGPGAVGAPELDGRRVRYTNIKHPERYCEAAEAGAALAFEQEELDEQALRMEAVMLGLRLNEGLPVDGLDLSQEAVSSLLERGWVEWADARLKLTRSGRHFCSEVALTLV